MCYHKIFQVPTLSCGTLDSLTSVMFKYWFLSNQLIYYLTPLNRMLLEKLIYAKLVKQFCATGSYSKTDASNTHLTAYFCKHPHGRTLFCRVWLVSLCYLSQIGEECCRNAKTAECHQACRAIFRSQLTPSREARSAVTESCSDQSPKVLQCVKNFTRVTPTTNPHKCKYHLILINCCTLKEFNDRWNFIQHTECPVFRIGYCWNSFTTCRKTV